jgi:hypothetical protein
MRGYAQAVVNPYARAALGLEAVVHAEQPRQAARFMGRDVPPVDLSIVGFDDYVVSPTSDRDLGPTDAACPRKPGQTTRWRRLPPAHVGLGQG